LLCSADFFSTLLLKKKKKEKRVFKFHRENQTLGGSVTSLEKFKGLSSCGIPFSVSASRLRNGEKKNFFLESSPFCGWGLLCEDYCVVDVLSD